jgi:AcrR family transcriptional regulator
LPTTAVFALAGAAASDDLAGWPRIDPAYDASVTTTPPGETPHPEPGLRERAKQRRRNRILRNAMRLFAERGYEATTVADIAAAAELAPRTLNSYFPNKIDMATAVVDEIADGLAEALTASDGADFVTVLDRWLTIELPSSVDVELIQQSADMLDANPSLRAVNSSHVSASAAVGTTVIARQLGLPPEHPAVTICTGAIGNAIGSYIGILARQGPNEQLHRWFLSLLTAMLNDARLPTD